MNKKILGLLLALCLVLSLLVPVIPVAKAEGAALPAAITMRIAYSN